MGTTLGRAGYLPLPRRGTLLLRAALPLPSHVKSASEESRSLSSALSLARPVTMSCSEKVMHRETIRRTRDNERPGVSSESLLDLERGGREGVTMSVASRGREIRFKVRLLTLVVPRMRPVRRAAMRPAFCPATACREMVEAFPMCWWFPPPWGWSTGFMATPRVLGHEFLFALNLWNARPALSKGLSIRPPPATIPMVARADPETVFLAPDGRRSRVLFSSTECPMTVA